jgi:hypothetical protein
MRPTSLKGDVDETVEGPNSSRFEKPVIRGRGKRRAGCVSIKFGLQSFFTRSKVTYITTSIFRSGG